MASRGAAVRLTTHAANYFSKDTSCSKNTACTPHTLVAIRGAAVRLATHAANYSSKDTSCSKHTARTPHTLVASRGAAVRLATHAANYFSKDTSCSKHTARTPHTLVAALPWDQWHLVQQPPLPPAALAPTFRARAYKCVGLARTVYVHRVWPHIRWFSCQKYRTHIYGSGQLYWWNTGLQPFSLDFSC